MDKSSPWYCFGLLYECMYRKTISSKKSGQSGGVYRIFKRRSHLHFVLRRMQTVYVLELFALEVAKIG